MLQMINMDVLIMFRLFVWYAREDEELGRRRRRERFFT